MAYMTVPFIIAELELAARSTERHDRLIRLRRAKVNGCIKPNLDGSEVFYRLCLENSNNCLKATPSYQKMKRSYTRSAVLLWQNQWSAGNWKLHNSRRRKKSRQKYPCVPLTTQICPLGLMRVSGIESQAEPNGSRQFQSVRPCWFPSLDICYRWRRRGRRINTTSHYAASATPVGANVRACGKHGSRIRDYRERTHRRWKRRWIKGRRRRHLAFG